MAKVRVLVVDDHSIVLKLVSSILQAHQYDVTAAASGQEALGLCTSGESTFDLLVSDVMMPGMGGPELARQLKKKGIDIPILFMTGYAFNEHELQAPVIRKPFTSDDLILALQAALQSADISQVKD